MDERIPQALKTLNDAKTIYRQTIALIQTVCQHKNLVECEYKDHGRFGYSPPYRMCTNCGLAEEGWGCGYTVLKDSITTEPVNPITRDELFTNRVGILIKDEDKGQLLRKEISVERMILQWIEKTTGV